MGEQALELEELGRFLKEVNLEEGRAKDWLRKVGEAIQVGAALCKA